MRAAILTTLCCVIACSTPRDFPVGTVDGGPGRDAALDVGAAGRRDASPAGGGSAGAIAGDAGGGMGGAAGAAGTSGSMGGTTGGAGGVGGAVPDGTGVLSISNEGGSISPEPGRGMITIKFTEPMDRVATVMSYESAVPASKLTFTWADDQTLVIGVLETLPFGTGDAKVAATVIRVTLTARTKAGQTLKPRSWQFTTWRYVNLVLPFAPAASGRIGKSAGAYVGDGKLTVGGPEQHRAFVSFDLAGMPVVQEVRDLQVKLFQARVVGSPYDLNSADFTNGAKIQQAKWTAFAVNGALYDVTALGHESSLLPQNPTLEWKSARLDEAAPLLTSPGPFAQFRVSNAKDDPPSTAAVIEFDTTPPNAPALVVIAWVI